MMTTFVGPEGPETVAFQLGRRRPAVARACAECQRRKVKCDGQLPCHNCSTAQVPCQYVERRRRTDRLSHRTTGAATAGDAHGYVAVFTRLFGQVPISAVQDCSRERLLALLLHADAAKEKSRSSPATSSGPSMEPLHPTQTESVSPSVSEAVQDAVQRLQTLEDGEAQEFEWNESDLDLQDAFADDVNALSLSANSRSSFLGIFSVAAVLRVLVKVLPSFVPQDNENNGIRPARTPPTVAAPAAAAAPAGAPVAAPARGGGAPVAATLGSPAFPQPPLETAPRVPYHEGQRLIDAYFSHVHVFVPMVHEPTFRSQYLSGSRRGSPWKALLYMVFALGSVASSTSDSEEDVVYYRAAQAHLGLESFGSGQMETLQALILMGGLYLHYRNRPNMASAIMGATNRMACGLGLHRDFHGGGDANEARPAVEIRRRTWFSNYILDSWGSETLGRPHAAAKFDTKPPRNFVDDETGEVPLHEPTIHSPLIHNISLCHVVWRIQSRLQTSPILDPREIAVYDKMLVDWYQQLPPFMRPPNPCPEFLQDARAVLTWRYLNFRTLVRRAVVLDATIRQIPSAGLEADEQHVVTQCRQLASDSIQSVRAEWRPRRMSGWQGVWFVFQACLVPLMALATEPPESRDFASWRADVQAGIRLCSDMAPWSLVGRKTVGVLEQLLRATEHAHGAGGGEGGTAVLDSSLDFQPNDLASFFFAGDWSDVMGVQDYPTAFDQAFLDSTSVQLLDAGFSSSSVQ